MADLVARRYTPYFFDKKLLDSILEASVDQHFHALIRSRQTQRRRDVLDGSVGGEVFEDNGESLFDPPEVFLLQACRSDLLAGVSGALLP